MKGESMFIGSREAFSQKLIIMRNEGWSIHRLSKRFGISRNTVRKILRAHDNQRDSGHDALKRRLKRTSKLDRFEPTIKQILEKYPNITGQRVYEKLREAGYTGGISILQERLQKHRPKEKEPVIRFETEPGRQGQMDWSPYTIPFIRTGKNTVQCFSYILGFSRRHYIDFTARHDFYTLIRRHQDAFEYFNGVPKECLLDYVPWNIIRVMLPSVLCGVYSVALWKSRMILS